MKLLFKQKLFSWFDNYDIYDEEGKTIFSIRGKVSWGYCLKIFDAYGNHIGTIKKRKFTLLPTIEIYSGNNYMGRIQKKFPLFKPAYNIDFNGWSVTGDIWGWNYQILNCSGATIATLSLELSDWNDICVIDVANPNDALYAFMLVIALEAGYCN